MTEIIGWKIISQFKLESEKCYTRGFGVLENVKLGRILNSRSIGSWVLYITVSLTDLTPFSPIVSKNCLKVLSGSQIKDLQLLTGLRPAIGNFLDWFSILICSPLYVFWPTSMARNVSHWVRWCIRICITHSNHPRRWFLV